VFSTSSLIGVNGMKKDDVKRLSIRSSEERCNFSYGLSHYKGQNAEAE
jgi:hypothetical protein